MSTRGVSYLSDPLGNAADLSPEGTPTGEVKSLRLANNMASSFLCELYTFIFLTL